jgi:hypothetical protein
MIEAVIKVAKIATGEIDDGKDKGLRAQGLGKKGGAARAKSLSKHERSEIARAAAAKRCDRS